MAHDGQSHLTYVVYVQRVIITNSAGLGSKMFTI